MPDVSVPRRGTSRQDYQTPPWVRTKLAASGGDPATWHIRHCWGGSGVGWYAWNPEDPLHACYLGNGQGSLFAPCVQGGERVRTL